MEFILLHGKEKKEHGVVGGEERGREKELDFFNFILERDMLPGIGKKILWVKKKRTQNIVSHIPFS